MPGRTSEGDALTALVRPVFALNAEFLATAAMITEPHGLTPAQWQVLRVVAGQPEPVAEIARQVGLGLTRQSVQRVANDVVDRGWAQWQDNPRHQRAKLLVLTDRGSSAVRALADAQHAWADAVGAVVGTADLARLAELLPVVIAASRQVRSER